MFGKNSKYKFRALKTYTSTEWYADNSKQYRTVFDSAKTDYIYTELSIFNKYFDEKDWKAEIHLRCLRQDADTWVELCNLKFDKTIPREDPIFYVREGWGDAQEGAFWENGNYCWQAFLDKVRTGRVNEKDKSKQAGYLRVLLEQADFSQKKKIDPLSKTPKKKEIDTLPPEVVLKKQVEKQQFEHDLEVADQLFQDFPNVQQDILDLINRLEQTAYTKENVADFPFLKSKIIFRLKQQFPDSFTH